MGRTKFILVFVVILLSQQLSAKPLFTAFNDVIKNSKYIFVGTYTQFSGPDIWGATDYHFKVNAVLKGDPGDQIKLGRSENGGFYHSIGHQYVVFVNNKNQFQWMGSFGDTLGVTDNSMISLEGFCDWNAHIVSPANISIGQLKQYIATGSYSGKINGYVNFFSSSTKKMEPSPIHIEVSYLYNDSLTSQVSVNGISLNDFAKKPEVYLPSFYSKITVEFDRNLYRPLSFEADLRNNQKNGSNWEVEFYLEMPGEINYEDLKTYLGNSKFRSPVFNLILTTEDSKSYPITWATYGDTYVNMNGKKIKCYGMELAPHRIIRFDKEPNQILFEMDSSMVSRSEMKDLSLDHLLIRELLYGPISGTLNIGGNKTRATLVYESCILQADSKY